MNLIPAKELIALLLCKCLQALAAKRFSPSGFNPRGYYATRILRIHDGLGCKATKLIDYSSSISYPKRLFILRS
jgi:hypothetical protein